MDAATVSSVPLFDSVPRRRRDDVQSWADEIEVSAGEVLIRQGDYAREFFVIVEGLAEVVRDGRHVATLGPGEFFGEGGLIEGPERSATVRAVTEIDLLVLGRREFSEMMHSTSTIAEGVLAAAARRRPQQG
jgi:CRP-like cAMP-binding protein